jgi:hypothetical protein
MADAPKRNLRDFDPRADRNGQDLGQDSPLDVGLPQNTQRQLASNPNGEAETARLASGRPNQGHTDAVEDEVPRENVERIGDPRVRTSSPGKR